MLSVLKKVVRKRSQQFKKFYCTKVPYEVEFEHKFSTDEERTILEQLNSASLDDLNRYSITSMRLKKLLAHRKKLGQFENLNQVLAVEGFGVNILRNLCNSILNPVPEGDKRILTKKIKGYNFVVPEISASWLENMKHVVGISLAPLSISWCGISIEERRVFSWGQHQLQLNPDVRRHHEMQLLAAAYDALSVLPEADTYVLESSSITSGTQQSANVLVNQQNLQISAMLLVLLNESSKDNVMTGRVIFQRNSLWCRLYGTLIGSERVSANAFVDEMLTGVTGPFVAPEVPDDLMEVFNNVSPLKREAMCAALLLTTCFLDVSVRPIPECLKILRGRARKV